jgi:ABC-type glycerol-3-phosphate transport system permease component
MNSNAKPLQGYGRTVVAARKLKWKTTDLAKYAFLVPMLFVFVIPFVWYATMALKSRTELAVNPLGWPADPQWDNFQKAWTTGHFSIYLPNTVIYAVSIVTAVCALSCLSGYALARLRFPGSGVITTFILMGMAVPFQSLMIPLYYLVNNLGLLGTRWGLVLPVVSMSLPFGTFMMSSFFKGIPEELANAARVDGATEWQVFWKVMLPLARPGLVTLAIFQFIWSWNLFLPALVLAQKDELRPIALGLLLFTGRYASDRGLIAAAIVLTILPVLVVYFFAQRRLIDGITAGAVK